MKRTRHAVIVTRPRNDSLRLARRLGSLTGEHTEIVIAPLLEIEIPGRSLDLSDYQGLVFTSANGVKAIRNCTIRENAIAFCVGKRTATAARKAGLTATAANGDAADLVDHIVNRWHGGALAYIRGTHAAVDLAAALRSRSLPTNSYRLYNQRRLSLGREARDVLGRTPCVLPVYSARTACILSEEAAAFAGCPHLAICMSARIVAALSPLRWDVAVTGRRGDGEAMVSEVLRAVGGDGHIGSSGCISPHQSSRQRQEGPQR